MKISRIVTILIALALSASSHSWAEDRITLCQEAQLRRIAQGVNSGAITNIEMRRLNREQERIQRAIQRAWSNGRLTPLEMRRINDIQREAGKHIYQATYDDDTYWRYPKYKPVCVNQSRPYFGYHSKRTYSHHRPAYGFYVYWK